MKHRMNLHKAPFEMIRSGAKTIELRLYDEKRKKIKAGAPYRGKGYGNIGLERLCNAAKKNGVDVLYDDIAIDNPAITMFLKHGFIEEYRTKKIIMLRKEL